MAKKPDKSAIIKRLAKARAVLAQRAAKYESELQRRRKEIAELEEKLAEHLD